MSVLSSHPSLRSDELISGAAGAGSLILEFALLSRLTGDERFEVSQAYHRPFQSLLDMIDRLSGSSVD